MASAEIAAKALSVRQTAKVLNVGHDNVYTLIRAGKLRTVRIGRRVVIPVVEIDRFLAKEMAS